MLNNNPKFNMALGYINSGSYEKAIDLLNECINTATEEGNPQEATQVRCILGELYANLGKKEDAINNFAQVLEYCNNTQSLPEQARIAATYIKAITEGKPANLNNKSRNVPLVPKPVQNKAFITKAMNKKRR